MVCFNCTLRYFVLLCCLLDLVLLFIWLLLIWFEFVGVGIFGCYGVWILWVVGIWVVLLDLMFVLRLIRFVFYCLNDVYVLGLSSLLCILAVEFEFQMDLCFYVLIWFCLLIVVDLIWICQGNWVVCLLCYLGFWVVDV